MNLPKRNSINGFTLIELLVGLTIIGLVFSFGFVNFRDFSRRQSFSGVVKNIKGDLRLAQENALAGKKPDSANCNSPRVLLGYEFEVASDGFSYTISAICSNGNVVVKSVALPSDISISSITTNPIRFNVLGNGTDVVTGNDTIITFTQTGNDTQATVSVSSSGEIE